MRDWLQISAVQKNTAEGFGGCFFYQHQSLFGLL